MPVTVTLYDGLNATGNVLSTAASTYTVTSAGPNTIAIVLNGGRSHRRATGYLGDRRRYGNSVAVNVNARDAQNNLIVSPGGYVDALNDPLTLHLTDSDTSGATAITPGSITAPSPSSKLNDNGGAASSATISATVSGGTIPGAITGATLTIQ